MKRSEFPNHRTIVELCRESGVSYKTVDAWSRRDKQQSPSVVRYLKDTDGHVKRFIHTLVFQAYLNRRQAREASGVNQVYRAHIELANQIKQRIIQVNKGKKVRRIDQRASKPVRRRG